MSVKYAPVLWNRNKYLYDAVLLAGVIGYIYLYTSVGPFYQDVTRPIDGAVLRMRAFGSCAFLMLTIILCIGPLARLDRRFLPLLYNRRHFGVLTAAVAAVHANYVLGWYFNFSPTDRYVALLSSNTSYGQVLGFPFETLGIAALLILFILAATSHDFWLSFLGAPLWKALHMLIYPAYAFVVLHVALGALQGPDDPVFTSVVAASVLLVGGLHFAAGRAEMAADNYQADASSEVEALEQGGWIVVCDVGEIESNRAKVVSVPGHDRVAVWKYKGKLSALSNACAHQNGPLGEGRIIDGAITCPWHGYQYQPEDGRSPAPFTEKISTYRLMLVGTTILLDPNPQAPGTYVEPVVIGEAS
ncbi:nitrite reductase/ring-hydroxylating ferredoxin subunit [Roseibium hamelinense]|uniref:Nitrite reductase/ring-hydroxylating ferredoxin subunit n=1 Tax=Roseibium hamelinense TaxID=150831 RepID=A0A562SZ19_9HYPH|nr:Rieske 2Fe-2S domain-containing protein [Roseibium hamelinense]MTI44822.1 (2Fe-2S)-binding protein [Roseibium hamelinense]TWI85986.1 nitrite reductase/ring-hydroxylating ferredoxin subunit [Roseibium hamelinense]